jgi:hypothetical protein
MAVVRYHIERNDKLAEFPQIAAREALVSMEDAVKITSASVQLNAPRGLGTFGGSITKAVKTLPDGVTEGKVGSSDWPPKVNAIEAGRIATFAKVTSAFKAWAASRGLNPYAVAKSIARKGIKPNPVFARSQHETEAEVQKILEDDLAAKIANAL